MSLPTAHALKSSTTPAPSRVAGVVYTPIALAGYVLGRLDAGGARPFGQLLDPACGEGVFLEVAIEALATRARTPLTTPGGARRFVDEVRRTIHGVDIDAQACETARARMVATVERLTGRAVRASFEANVVHRDFLLDDGWDTFDAIVGNPPYVATSFLTTSQKDAYRRRFQCGHGRIDLYLLFIEAAVRRLRPGGRLAFITPDKFLLSQSARRLRELLAGEGATTGVARFRSHRLFGGVATVPCVTTFERARAQGGVDFVECASDGARIVERLRDQVPASDLRPEGWRLIPRELREIEDKIRGRHQTLETVSRRISAGLATGRDEIYVMPEAVAKALGLESALLRRTVGGRNVQRGRITPSGDVVLVPYEFDETGTPFLVDLKRYPRAKAHLEAHRGDLSSRHCVRVWGKPWWDLHDPVPTDLARLPKVLVPDVAEHNRFAPDDGTVMPLHSAYYIVPAGLTPRALAALLNSLPLEFLLRLTLPLVKDGFSRYRAQFLARVPIPALAPKDQSALERGEDVDTLALRLFGLDAADAQQMRAFLLDLRTAH